MVREIVEGRFAPLKHALLESERTSGVNDSGTLNPSVFPYTPKPALPRLRYGDDLVELVNAMLTVPKNDRPNVRELLAKPAVVKRLASELDEARRENEKLREDLFRERNDREIEVETERKKREASHKLAVKTADDVSKIQRANSVPATVGGGQKNETLPSQGSVKIEKRLLRPIADPGLEILGVLHKLSFVDRLPPAAVRDHNRASVRRFVSCLWAPNKSAAAVKAETAKLLSGSRERFQGFASFGNNGSEAETYEDVLRSLETLLLEHGFYALQRQDSR